LAIVAGALGCAPKIGDKCSISTDCSVSGDRLCDSTQPAGYCTVFNCEPNQCPDDALCVAFNEPTCSSPAQATRFRRTFCMAVCESDGDCRAGYRCLDVTSDPARQVVDINPSSHLICTVPPVSTTPPPTLGPAVCNPSDANFESPPPEGPADAGGDGDGGTTTDVGPDLLLDSADVETNESSATTSNDAAD
jgi:hypothetical protein